MNPRYILLIVLLVTGTAQLRAQLKLDTKLFNRNGEVTITRQDQLMEITWPAGNLKSGKVQFDLSPSSPLFKRIALGTKSAFHTVSEELDPAFLLSIGKRDLLSQNGWNIFFDKVPLKPFKTFPVILKKNQ